MIYRFMVDRRFGFLYTAKQTRLFPMILMMFNARQTLASVITTAKLRFGNSRLDISTSKKRKCLDKLDVTSGTAENFPIGGLTSDVKGGG